MFPKPNHHHQHQPQHFERSHFTHQQHQQQQPQQPQHYQTSSITGAGAGGSGINSLHSIIIPQSTSTTSNSSNSYMNNTASSSFRTVADSILGSSSSDSNNGCWNQTHSVQLPNLRELLHDTNYQRSSPPSSSPNNHFFHVSNNNNHHTSNIPNNNMYMRQHKESSFIPLSSTSTHVSSGGHGKDQIGNSIGNPHPITNCYPSSNNASPPSTITSSQHSFGFSNYPNSFRIQQYPASQQHANDSQDNTLIHQLQERILELERDLELHSRLINDLQQENQILKANSQFSNGCVQKNNSSTATVANANAPGNATIDKFNNNNNNGSTTTSMLDEEKQLIANGKSKKKRKRKTSPNSSHQQQQDQNHYSNVLTTKTTFSLVDESSSGNAVKNELDEQLVVGEADEFSVNWKGETYVLVDVFKNRTQIMNYYVPLYQSQFPDRNCKVVLSSEEYKQLFRENAHRSQSERKHAWRISIFTIDFYNFVKNQQV